MVFPHFWNMQNLIFYSYYNFFYCILKAILRRYLQVKTMLSAKFFGSAEDFHPYYKKHAQDCFLTIAESL